MSLEEITKSWGKPRSKKAREVFLFLVEMLRIFLENDNIPFLWETFWVQNGVSLAKLYEWEKKFGSQDWFRNAMKDLKVLFADNIVRHSKFLGPENTKKLLERIIEQQQENEIIIKEIVEIKQ